MSELLRLIAAEDNGDDVLPNAYVIHGLGIALLFAEALIPRLQGTEAHVAISGWGTIGSSGLFFHDEIQGRAVRVSANLSAGCGRMFLGKSEDFEFPSREPKDHLTDRAIDFELSELDTVIDSAIRWLLG